MEFSISKSIAILQKTPPTLHTLLAELSDDWIYNNEGEDTWSPYDIIGHFIHGEKTDWIPRVKIILNQIDDSSFEPFDRFAQFENSKGRSLEDLLNEFANLRKVNLNELIALNINSEQLNLTGKHPEFGTVTLAQLLATWVAHDMGHIAQIARVIAKQYKVEVGPWKAYLRILRE